jgi:3-hydroxy-9,10-secoandrosta-1,3,5(10)-triene-9,17-dione monooxygenase
VAAVLGEHSWVISQFPEAAQREVWGRDSEAVSSACIQPSGEGLRAAGGFRLTGRWGFSSGCDHAQWVLLGAIARDGEKPAEQRFFLLPKREVEVIDDWHVMGLAGTGSKSIAVKGVFVPEHRSVTNHDIKAGRVPGAALHPDYQLCRSPRSLFSVFSLSSVVVGLAERAAQEFVDQAGRRQSRGQRVADIEAIQLTVAQATAQVETAALLAETTIDRNIASVASGEPIGAERVAWSRRNSAFATQLSVSAVNGIFQAAGGGALYDSNPLQEILRDITAGASHLGLTWHRAALPYGQSRLGHEIDFDAL